MNLLFVLLYLAVCCGLGIGLGQLLYKYAEHRARRSRP